MESFKVARGVRVFLVGLLATLVYFAILTTEGTLTHTFTSLDFAEMYNLGAATLHGQDPYARSVWLYGTGWAHPTPMPPSLGLLAAPLALIPHDAALVLWEVLQAECWLFGVFILLRLAYPRIPVLFAALVAGLGALWQPIIPDLAETTLAQFFFLALAYWAYRTERPTLSGVCLALCVLIKPFCLPILAWPLIRRDWKATRAMCETLAGIGIASLLAIGPASAMEWTRGTSLVTSIYRGVGANPSLWSVSTRLFVGIGSPNHYTEIYHIPALFPAPALVPYADALILGTATVLLAVAAIRQTDARAQLGVLITAGLLLSPISWNLYLPMLLVALPALWPHRILPLFACCTILLNYHNALQVLAIDLGGGYPTPVSSLVWFILIGGLVGLAYQFAQPIQSVPQPAHVQICPRERHRDRAAALLPNLGDEHVTRLQVDNALAPDNREIVVP